MSKMIQIRNVPEALHKRLKARSAMAGMSLSDYLLAEIRRVAERPTIEELRVRIQARSPVEPRESPRRSSVPSATVDDRYRRVGAIGRAPAHSMGRTRGEAVIRL
jgi:antitoxin FitA